MEVRQVSERWDSGEAPGEHPELDLEQEAKRQEAMKLFFAVADGHPDRIKALLETRVDPNARDWERRCPLHVVAGLGGSRAICKVLIEYQANVNATDCWGQTPLDQAERGSHFKVEKFLKDNGAKNQREKACFKAIQNKWEVKRSEVQLGKELGRTLKSVVNVAKWNGIDVVAKFCLPEASGEASTEIEDEMLHEIEILGTVRHPDLVLFLGCCLKESPLMIITQYMPRGDLEQYYLLQRRGSRTPWAPDMKRILGWALAVSRALTFLHHCSQPIIHRDLKPLNLLLTETLEVKVSDFGISKITRVYGSPLNTPQKIYGATVNHTQLSEMAASTMTGGVGSWRYMAPEVTRYQNYNEKVDIYSFALILFFMSCGRQPFYEYKDPVLVLNEYAKGNEPRPKIRDCPSVLGPIMEGAWHPNPAERPEASVLTEQLAMINTSGGRCACSTM